MKRVSNQTVDFNGSILPRYVNLQDILNFLVNESTVINYQFLMQFLLFLPSFTSPNEFMMLLINCFKGFAQLCDENSGTSSFTLAFIELLIFTEKRIVNILIIIRCWLRESFAHADFSGKALTVRIY